MVAPTFEDTTGTGFSTQAASFAANLPSTVNADDLLLMFAVAESADSEILTEPSGWTEVYNVSGSFGSTNVATCWALKADGTEDGGTATYTAGGNTTSCCVVARISGWSGTIGDIEHTQTNAGTNSSSPDPPNHAPSGGSDDYLWLAVMQNIDDDEGVSAYPTNYSINQTSQVTGGGANDGGAVGIAGRQLTASSQNPGTFTTTGNDVWVATTLSIPPSAAAPDAAIIGAKLALQGVGI